MEDYLFPDNKYKLHACCHGLHPMIEALLAAYQMSGVTFDDISAFTLETNPRWLAVCDIKAPRTGLEVKFSYNWLAGMTLRGVLDIVVVDLPRVGVDLAGAASDEGASKKPERVAVPMPAARKASAP